MCGGPDVGMGLVGSIQAGLDGQAEDTHDAVHCLVLPPHCTAACKQQTIHSHSEDYNNNRAGHPRPRLNIKAIFPMYGDSHVKDKTVGETVLSLT